jgi:hypothetical protein
MGLGAGSAPAHDPPAVRLDPARVRPPRRHCLEPQNRRTGLLLQISTPTDGGAVDLQRKFLTQEYSRQQRRRSAGMHAGLTRTSI